MNATLKAIQQLIKHPEREVQLAAIRVLGVIRTREPAIHKSLGELLVATDQPDLREAILAAFSADPHEQALRYLLRLLEREDDYPDAVLDAIARIGPKAVPPLRSHFENVPLATQRRLVRVLPRLKNPPAHQFLVEALAHNDTQLVRETVHALREEMPRYGPGERADLYAKLVAALKDTRFRQGDGPRSAVIISLGILADPRAKARLLPFTKPDQSPLLRRHALLSLARLEYGAGDHRDVADALWPMLDEAAYEELVRHALTVLERLPPASLPPERLRALLANRHEGVRIFAVRALARGDNAGDAALLLPLLAGPSAALAAAAADALAAMPSAAPVLVKALEEASQAPRAAELLRLLENHPGKLAADRAKALFKRMTEARQQGDGRQERLRQALAHLRPDVLRGEVERLAKAAFEKKHYAEAVDRLRILEEAGLLAGDNLYRQAVAELKTSRKERSRAFRQADPALEHVARLLADDPKGLRQRLVDDKALGDDEYLYLGFHFSERFNEERRFGADLLRYVVQRTPRSALGKAARAKLKVESL